MITNIYQNERNRQNNITLDSSSSKEEAKLWKTPIYKFRLPKSTMDGNRAIEVTIDVTKSIPGGRAANTIAKDLRSCFNDIFDEYKIETVIEFGAGNLKNVLYLLNRGLKVHAVDFKDILDQKKVQEHLEECEKFGDRFGQLIFPDEFLKVKDTYDFALLAHVFPVMPIFVERLLALQYIYKKVRKNGYLLWYSQVENKDYRTRRESGAYTCGDGIWMGKNQKYRTFFKHFDPIEIDEILLTNGFTFIKRFACRMGHLRFYQKDKYNVFSNFITENKIKSQLNRNYQDFQPLQNQDIIVNLSNRLKPVTPNPKGLTFPELLYNRLDTIEPGRDDATLYHRFSAYLFYFCLYDQLESMKIEKEIDDKLGRIDVTFRNRNKEGCIKNIAELSRIKCPIISVECKNYSSDINNPQILQIADRLNKTRGLLGFMLCREIKNRDIILKLCKRKLQNDDKYILILEDNNLKEMLKYKFNEDDEAINGFLLDKYEELVN